MKKGDHVKLTKLGNKVQHPEALDDKYWLLGRLIYDIEVGRRIEATRVNRNGVESFGHFESSFVTRISGNLIETENSMWQIDDASDDPRIPQSNTSNS